MIEPALAKPDDPALNRQYGKAREHQSLALMRSCTERLGYFWFS